MNDYKELIEDLRLSVTCGHYRAVTVLKSMLSQAADAIEQLVNDRNASVDALKALVENIDALPTRNGHWLLKFHDEETEAAIRLIIALCVEKPDYTSATTTAPNCSAKMDEDVEHEAD